jgi:hypothetical protein
MRAVLRCGSLAGLTAEDLNDLTPGRARQSTFGVNESFGTFDACQGRLRQSAARVLVYLVGADIWRGVQQGFHSQSEREETSQDVPMAAAVLSSVMIWTRIR